jgi:hypothetical protein
VDSSLDYPLQKCAEHPGHYLDAPACHAAACSSAYAARTRKHNNLAKVLAAAAREADCDVSREPETHTLLLSEFTAADCHRIFPKNNTTAYKIAFNKLVATTHELQQPSCKLSQVERSQVIQSRIDALPVSSKRVGLRVDLSIVNPRTNETKWVDTTSVNTAASSVIDREVPYVKEKQSVATVASNLALPYGPCRPSPALEAREAFKREKYSCLLTIANRQYDQGKRARKPTFSPFAISTTGDLGPEASLLIDWLVTQYAIKCQAQGPRVDGLSKKELITVFRHNLKIDLLFAMAAGMGEMITRAGLPLSPAV